VPGVFPPDDVRHFKREFRWLGGVTGPTRDLDVYLLKIPEYRAALEERQRADLDPLIDLLQERQREAHQRLVAELDSPRFDALMREWTAFLAEPPPPFSELPQAMRVIDDVASARIWRAWRRAKRRGHQVVPDSPRELLHRLRIDCKKLRYLLEFFSGLYPPDAIAGLIAALKKLQTNLGDLNDIAVQAEALRGFERELADRGGGAATLVAIERLVGQLEERRARERADSDARFAEFTSSPVADTFRRLFHPPASVAP
jgi:CHAD domain-containing protein